MSGICIPQIIYLCAWVTLMDILVGLLMVYNGVYGGYGVGQRNSEGRMLLECCLENELCVSNIWSKREEKRKVTFRMGENETEIDFVLINKEH